MREYGIDLLDFYRGALSARRLGVLVRELSAKSSLVKALNGNQPPWSRVEHLLADMWVVLVRILNPKSKVADHPVRAEMQAKQYRDQEMARIVELRAVFEKRRRTYGVEESA